MQVNKIQSYNGPVFGARLVKDKVSREFSRAVTRYLNLDGFKSERAINELKKLNQAIDKFHSINGDTLIEMYSDSPEFICNNTHLGLGFINPANNKRIINTENLAWHDTRDNIIDGFVMLVDKIEKDKNFWAETPASKLSNEIFEKLTK